MEQIKEQTAGAKQHLRFHLVPDTVALLPVDQITEVLTIPIAQVVPIPHMPPWVTGVYKWRGEILWMLDLGHLVGLTPLYQANSRSYTAIVIHSTQEPGKQTNGGAKLGLLVNSVEDMEWCHANLIQSPPQSVVNRELVRFLRGYWLKSNGEILVVLDSNLIIAGMSEPNASLARQSIVMS